MKGIGVSSGIAIGKAFVIKKSEHALTGILLSSDSGTFSEIAKFDQAVATSVQEVQLIISNKDLKLQEEEIAILETQIEFLSDPQIRIDVLDKIQNNHSTAHDSLILVIHKLVEMFKNMDDEYMSARSADIQDIGYRILKHLNNSFHSAAITLEKDTIIIAEDISPSDTITMDLEHVIGFATGAGSRTSHTAILAKAKGIPAVVGCGDRLSLIKNNDVIILDGKSGYVLVNPDNASLNEYIRLRTDHIRMTEALKSLMDVSAVTVDGTEISLMGNISDAEGLNNVFDNGGEGVGLFRTEILFMGRSSLPSEDEQFAFYKKVADNSNNCPVVVRTIDIGGDKEIKYLGLAKERNPFLGYRAIRISLDQPDLFIAQLKAILRASAFGNFKIMFPMISNISELRRAKELLEQAKESLRAGNIAFDENLQTGIMIEIPSAAIMADIFAKEVDFFSIGTNDLCQYTLAVDRMNEKIEHLYDPFNPGVLRLIKYTIEQAEKNNIHVGICGEMASEPLAVQLLLGMGLRELSMNAGSISEVKEIILNTDIENAKELCGRVMEMTDSDSIVKYLKEQNRAR
ncbi:phosphoenolpyruvate--protein phosphotransferase [Daejeonella lutea]|uniref:Phosphoenolpyruvate-protein phosphotransferase n=1 Tax=Daejeonella lutea TaxID=572036 RepID=A0A1T5F7Q6_9SPHI|nr:phosphoenolpyruvate--protein phosphotransferase [Daejeonella lutea]SKB92196.1 phosphotransferase system, enzyme I, PtsI [Daejeonella lutea]